MALDQAALPDVPPVEDVDGLALDVNDAANLIGLSGTDVLRRWLEEHRKRRDGRGTAPLPPPSSSVVRGNELRAFVAKPDLSGPHDPIGSLPVARDMHPKLRLRVAGLFSQSGRRALDAAQCGAAVTAGHLSRLVASAPLWLGCHPVPRRLGQRVRRVLAVAGYDLERDAGLHPLGPVAARLRGVLLLTEGAE